MLGWTYKCVYCWFQHVVFMIKIDGKTFIMSLDFWPPPVTHTTDKNKEGFQPHNSKKQARMNIQQFQLK